MIHIERIRLRLPAHLQAQAQAIAWRIARRFATSGPHAARRIASVRVPPIRVDASAGPSDIADLAARGILEQLRGNDGGNR